MQDVNSTDYQQICVCDSLTITMVTHQRRF